MTGGLRSKAEDFTWCWTAPKTANGNSAGYPRACPQKGTSARLFGKAYVKTEYVFCWPDGRPITSDYVSHRLGKLLKKHGLPHICFHELRHSCASLLINNGCGLKEVQEWMGRSDIGTTANIYGHLETQRKQAMAEKLAGCING